MLSGNLTGLPKDSSERVSRNNVLRLQGINKQKLPKMDDYRTFCASEDAEKLYKELASYCRL